MLLCLLLLASSLFAYMPPSLAQAAPQITLSPTSGATGTSVTITGSSFATASTIRLTFDGAVLTSNPATITTTATGTFSATFSVPASAAAGPHSVAATNSNGNTDAKIFTVVTGTTSTLTIRSQNADGATITGYFVQLRNSAGASVGTGFTPVTFTLTKGAQYSVAVSNFQSVVFHHWLDTGATASQRSVTITANTELTAVYGTTSATIFTSPSFGPAGTSVTVTGTNFPAGSAIAINFDGSRMTTVPATVTASSSGGFSATFSIPSAAAAGAHTISVTGGTATDSAPFTVKPNAAITASPASGPQGTTVTITGTNFPASTFANVAFDGTNQLTSPASVTTSAAGGFTTTIVVPSTASGAHTISARSGAATATAAFTATTPSVTTSPVSGLPGTTVTVTGSNFKPSSAVTINYDGAVVTTTPATVTSTSAGAFSATFVVPSSSTTGAHITRATTGAATGISTFTVTSAPSITLSPTSGPVNTSITVTGANYPTSATVTITFNGTSVPTTPATVTTSATGTFSAAIAVPASSGTGQATVRAASGTAAATATFTVSPSPSITLSPTSGQVGTTVTVTGANYPASSTVSLTFNGTALTTNPTTVTSSPAGAFTATFAVPSSGTGQATVRATSGTASSTAAFTVTPAASISLSPTSGPTGTVTTVTGSNYPASATVTITFNGTSVPTTPPTVTTTSTGTFSATFSVPSASGTGAATVRAASGAISSAAPFTVTAPPSITLTPTSGVTGTTVTIAGSNYPASSQVAVTFNGTAVTTVPTTVTTTSAGAFSATFTVPPSSNVGANTVRASSGSSAATAAFTVVPPPSIALSPVSGPAGASVTVTGSNYPAAATVTITFNGTLVSTIPTTITTTGSGTFSASFNVPSSQVGAATVRAASGTAAATATFTVSPSPSITLSPTSGQVGTTVTVTGSNYPASANVALTFNGTTVATDPTTVTTGADGSFSATFTVPSSQVGAATVRAAGGTVSSTAQFTVTAQPSIDLNPTSGPTGVQVTVTGSNYPAGGTVVVTFNGTSVNTNPSPIVASSAGGFTATFIVPASSALGQATVRAASGSTAATAAFTVSASPSIALSPSSGQAGTTVTVTGANYPASAAVTITFNGTSVPTSPTSVVASSTGTFSATFTVPSSAATGPAPVRAASATAADTATFTVTPAASITLNPVAGPTGSDVTVTGTHYPPNATVALRFNGTVVATTPSTVSTTSAGAFSATFTVPSGSAAGDYPVQASSGTTSVTATFTVTALPSITLNPTSGPTGTQVTVSGANYPVASTVSITFNGTAMTTAPTPVTAASDGTFSASFAVPSSTATGPATVRAASGTATASSTFTVTPAPSITLNPTSGPASTTVSIAGSNYPAGATVAVTFNGTSMSTNPATVTASSSGAFSATFAVPSSAVAGVGTVRAVAGSTSSSASFTVIAQSPPSITLSPASGPVGIQVTVSGTNFAPSSAITITYGGAQVTTTPSTVTSDSSGDFTATFNAPPSTAGLHTVAARDEGAGNAQRAFTVAPSLTLNPSSGTPGTQVTVTGTGFAANSPITVTYDDAQVGTATSNASGGFTTNFAAPESTAGAHTIVGTDGSNNSANGSFTVGRALALSPTSGNVGTQVTATGSGFRANATITISFDGVQVPTTPSTITTNLSGSFTARFSAPASSSGVHGVSATGILGISADADFTTTPSIAASPTSGPTGTQVTVAGTGFAANSQVSLTYDGTQQATTPSQASSNGAGSFSVVFSVPAPSATGAHTIRASTGAAVNATTAFTVTTPVTPQVTLSPTTGPAGTTVTITGSNYPPSSQVAVTFAGTAVTTTPPTITSTSAGAFSATFNVPSGAAAGPSAVNATSGSAFATATFTVTSPSPTPSLSLFPASGPIDTRVTVTGANFTSNSAITLTFGSVQLVTSPASLTSNSTGYFAGIITIPASTPGTHPIQASDSGARVASANFVLTNSSITLDPPTARVGSTVTVTGMNFAPGSAVTITYDGAPATTVPASIASDASGEFSATFVAPPSTAGSHTVGVSTGNNEVLQTISIIPTLTVNPASGPIDTQVTVTGTGFAAGAGIGLTFDSNPLTSTTPSTITTGQTGGFTASFRIPSSDGGAHTVGATSGALSAVTQFTMTATATITLSPSSGPVDTLVTVTGSNFPASSTVTLSFNGTSLTTTPGTITATSAGNFTATFRVPASATAGQNTVTATGGSRTASDIFAVTTPSLSLNPATGAVGTTVTITGANYPPGSQVSTTFNGTVVTTNPATVTVSTTGSFTATFIVPSSATGDALVRSAAGAASAQDTFTVIPPSAITLNPASGPAGTSVTVSGTGFAANSLTTIRYDGATVTTVPATVNTSTQGAFSASFTIPAASTAGEHIVQATDATNRIASANFTASSRPTAVSQTADLVENTPATITFAGSDPDGGPVSFYVTSQPQHGILSEVDQTTGKVVYRPLKNYEGTDSFTFVSNDCTADSATATVSLNIASGTNLPVDITVYTDNAQGDPLAGFQIFLEQNGVDIQTLFSPGTFTLNFGQLYTIAVTGFADFDFDHWADNGSTNNHRNVTPSADAVYTAVLRQASISINPATGSSGTILTVTGQNFDPSKAITLGFNGAVVQPTPSPLVTDSAGAFTGRFTVPAIQAGDYTVTATDGDSTAARTFSSANTVTLSPTFGPAGTAVTVTGSGFAANSAITVRFDSTQVATTTSNAQGSFSTNFTVPAAATTGSHQVQVSDAASHVSTVPFSVTNAVVTLNPTSANVGNTVTVNGTGFIPSTAITITMDGSPLSTTPTSVTSSSSGSFSATFVVPASSADGQHTIGASDGANNASAQLTVFSTLISLSPSSGGTGSTVTVNGTGFAANSAITLRYDGNPVSTTPPTVTSNGQGAFIATFAVPGGSATGAHPVTATDASSGTASAQFTVTQTSTLIVSSQDSAGNTITGYFTSLSSGGTTVATGFTPATFTVNNGQAYSVAVSGFQNVVFDHWADNGSTTNPRPITITTTTQLTAIYRAATTTLTPSSGPTGTVVTVAGTQFAKGAQIGITLDGAAMTTNPPVVTASAADGSFTATVTIPSTATAGAHTISATDGVTPVGRTFTVVPTISLNPTSGPAGTTSMTVSGDNFTPGSTITIRFDATTVTTNPATVTVGTNRQFSATFTVPAGAAIGQHTVTASNPAGQTASQSFAVTNAAISLSPSSAKVGSTVTVTGSNFNPSATITVRFDGAVVTTNPATVTSSAAGAFTATFVVPAATDGPHSVSASDGTNGPIGQLTVYTTTTSLSPSAAGTGTQVTITGSGFAANSAITVRFDSTQVATTTSNAQGAFTAQFNVPAGATAGSHTVTSTDAASPANSASSQFVVTTQSTVTVSTQDTSGNALTGYFTTATPAGGSTQTGFTTATFTVPNGQVTVTISGYGTFVFDHWLDNNSTAASRTLTVNTNTQLVAVLRNTA